MEALLRLVPRRSDLVRSGLRPPGLADLGKPMTPEQRAARNKYLLDKMRALMHVEGEHLIWDGPVNEDSGYPYFRIRYRGRAEYFQARRTLYEITHHRIRAELKAVPNCERGQECVRPSHALLVTHGEWLVERRYRKREEGR